MSPMARSEVHTTIRRIRRQLHSGHRLEYLELAVAITDSDTTLTVLDDLPRSVQRNSIIEVGIEQMRVRGYNESAKTIEVNRGWADSDPVAHSMGDEVTINSRFSKLDIYDALVSEVNSWGPTIYRVEASTFAYVLGSQTVELPVEWVGMYFPISVRGKRSGQVTTDGFLFPITYTKWPRLDATLLSTPVATLPDANTSGLLMRIPDSSFVGTVYIAVALPLQATDVLLTADLVEDVGVPNSAIDLVDLGVKRRLAFDGEYGRAQRDVQGDARDAAENPPGSNAAWLRLLDATYMRRMSEESYKLLNQNPITFA
jgi:hypothetical protein